jgi:hypothetical protein
MNQTEANGPSADGPNDGDPEFDPQADAMKDQLRKDVANWSSARAGGEPGRRDPAPATAAAAPAAKQPAARAPRQKAKPVEPVQAAAGEKKPFRMSYDGTTDKDYIAQRLKLGAR